MMPASNVSQDITIRSLLHGVCEVSPEQDCAVQDISLNSAAVKPGTVFFALQGTQAHGLQYAGQALDNGAVAIIADGSGEHQQLNEVLRRKLQQCNAVLLWVDDLRNQLGGIAERFYQSPSKQLKVIGITGTNGKTSCTQFIAQALNEDAPSSVVGTIGNGLVNQLEEATHTTPDVISLHRLMREFVDKGAASTVMEVSSHGLEQGRVNGIGIDVAVFTNLSQDHLDYHGDMQSYAAAKRRLFEVPDLTHAVINADDEFGRQLIKDFSSQYDVTDYSVDTANASARLRLTSLVQDTSGMRLNIEIQSGAGELRTGLLETGLLGKFNAANLLAALGVLLSLGISLDVALQRLSRAGNVNGRMEKIEINAKHPLMVVDYAHTPDALEKALSALREHVDFSAGGKLWCVFGCGGDRDQGKRSAMGAVAEKNADRVVVTDDNPRTENSGTIIDDILSGTSYKQANRQQDQSRMQSQIQSPAQSSTQSPITVIADRISAIDYAVASAAVNDVVLVAGKGHENYQIIGTEKRPYQGDVRVIQELLEKHYIKGGKS